MLLRRSFSLIGIAAVTACGQLIGIQELDHDAGGERPDAGSADVGVAPDVPPLALAKRVFVTSDVSDGIMGGVPGADRRCMAAAERGNLSGGPWIAWIAGAGTSGMDRIKHEGAYDLLDGRRVVSNKNQLASGPLSAPINITETGQLATGNLTVWTGTLRDGRASPRDCYNWTSNNSLDFGLAGSLDRLDWWTQNPGPGPGVETWGCQTQSHLYCFEL